MKKIIALILVFTMALPGLCACGKTPAEEDLGDTAGEKNPIAVIEVENYGTITVELYPEIAPITVENFVSLAKSGFYDGLTFHRIISGFMIQGGDPNGDGTGGNTDADGNEITITGEFSENGIQNDLSHTRGVISMARSGVPSYYPEAYQEWARNSASSQFFIMHEDGTYLDGQYAAFGMVTSGMEVVDAIAANTKTEDTNGTVLAENQPKIISVTIR